MQIRLPEIYCDAKEVIEKSLENKKFVLSTYNSQMISMCEVTHFHIKDEEDKDRTGTLELLLNYREKIITKYDKFETLNKTQTLMILTTKGDPIWPFIMVSKVFNGEYPSGVAYNKETGVVYLMYIHNDYLEMKEFGILKENMLECVSESLNEVAPYRIRLDEDAMFNVLSEQEGNRCLHDTLYIEFDCGVKFRVYNERKFGV
jgi:hypothetical protein